MPLCVQMSTHGVPRFCYLMLDWGSHEVACLPIIMSDYYLLNFFTTFGLITWDC